MLIGLCVVALVAALVLGVFFLARGLAAGSQGVADSADNNRSVNSVDSGGVE